ncbi:unnamed protein product [Vitrella brassicaformis CCMP3155]|uniref:Uncharacterized protein n=1 Tax=Vitrella brassicaformis (strain CCMP3155) TaxID=1169540 RepID=A0A0G4ERM1_VITBC|nr:unnamed protein product [Vitrella brassicaformis CCMP3155]|eukprot:CEM00517.1 unnamed protein product [Vitrella brassicaformis CCMP3155]
MQKRASRRLSRGIINRTFTSAQEVTDLIEQQGADPDVEPLLRKGTGRCGYPLLSYSIDNASGYTMPSIWMADDETCPVALPLWSSLQLESDIITALIDGGADINAPEGYMQDKRRPLRVAIAAGNEAAVDLLLERGEEIGEEIDGAMVLMLPVMVTEHAFVRPSRDYEQKLLAIYERLRIFANETDDDGRNVLHHAGYRGVVAYGADVRGEDFDQHTPLAAAASHISPCVAESLCRRLSAADINRSRRHLPPPFQSAASWLPDPATPPTRIAEWQKRTTMVLLRAGADITCLPTATEEDRRQRNLVLAEYTTVLNELPNATMSAINGALAPQRDHCFSPAIAWKIGAFLHEPSAAPAAIDQYLIGDTQLRRRVKAAVGHFVKSAATQTSSNREVVGGTRYEQQGDKRVKVTVPPLQCFAIRAAGSEGQVVGLREVVHKARLDEVAKYQLTGVQKGFNEHLGDQDCQFDWQQLGYIDKDGVFQLLLTEPEEDDGDASEGGGDDGADERDGDDGDGEGEDDGGAMDGDDL